MKTLEVLRKLDLGNSVAEFDEALDQYFVDTEPFNAVVENRADVIAGDKGTGKTAIFRTLRRRYRQIEMMKGIEVLAAFNPSGNPIFQRLAQEKLDLTEAQYGSVWKAYVFSLVGNWLLGIVGTGFSENCDALDKMLSDSELRSQDDEPATIFSRLVNAVRRLFQPKAAELSWTFSESGIPIVTHKLEFYEQAENKGVPRPQEIPFEDAFRLLNRCLDEIDITCWIALDRLDEAFQGFPNVETPALRALFRTYLDLLEFDRMRLKLFVRRDLFRKIVKGGFVNLTHINARKKEILWEEEDLLNLLCERTRKSGDVLDALNARSAGNDQIFDALFPKQIDNGERRPTSWNWMMARIQDGNGVRPPRNLIDLVMKAREDEIKRADREKSDFVPGEPLLTSDSVKRALSRLSESRVEDTLLAEAGDAAPVIELFRGGKSEHNDASLAALLNVPEQNVVTAIKPLLDAGFLGQIGATYKIPPLYRDGLKITQGKAF